jgi:hypothetical protein
MTYPATCSCLDFATAANSAMTDDEKAALIEVLRGTIDRDRFPLSPRIKLLRSVAKLAPEPPRPQPRPAPTPSAQPSTVLAKSRRRRGCRC